MLYEYQLGELGKEFATRDLAPVIVKGQAIVDLAFPEDEIRLSSDIDLLVGDDGVRIAAVMEEIGYKEKTEHSRPFSSCFGERAFLHSGTRLPSIVEVHRQLDKILTRPISYPEILARAKPSGRSGFRYPAIEDLLLLVVLHASTDFHFDPERVERDLRFLIDRGKPDMDIVWLRARNWELSRALRRLLSGQYTHDRARPRGATAYLAAQLLLH